MRFLSRLFEINDLILIRRILNGQVYTEYVFCNEPISHSKHNTFFGVCPREEAGKDKAADIKTVRCLWADIDNTTDWKKRCENVPQPTLVVLTGGGVQCYWKLKAPICPDVAVPRLRWLIQQVGGDHCHDVSRVLRLPGSVNYKYNPPRDCCWIRDSESSYEYSEFPETHPVPVVQKECWASRGSDVSPRLLEYVESVALAPVGQRSSREFSLVCYAISTGHSPDAVWSVVAGVGKFAERGRQYFDRTWENAMAKVGMKDSV